jgi:hypothetical protein
MEKKITVVCYDTGLALVNTEDFNIHNENNASVIEIDFSNTSYQGENKWVDLVLADGTSLRYDLGIEDVVEAPLTYATTVPGQMIVTPFIYDGVNKIKYKSDQTVLIYEQEEAGDEAAVERDDYIADLEKRVKELEDKVPEEDAPVTWDDLNFPLNLSRRGNRTKPDYDDENLGFLFPRDDTSEYIDFIVQMPHAWKEGSEINPHVHIQQDQALQGVFKIEYIWYNIGDPIPDIWEELVLDQYAIDYVSGNIAQILEPAAKLDGTGKRISSILKIRLYRDDDVYVGDLFADQFDIHYQLDSNGSIEEYVKQEEE